MGQEQSQPESLASRRETNPAAALSSAAVYASPGTPGPRSTIPVTNGALKMTSSLGRSMTASGMEAGRHCPEVGQAVTTDYLRNGEFLDANVIGGKPEGRWQKFFFEVDPFKQDEYVRNVHVHQPKKNVSFALVYWAILIAYTVYAFVQYFNRPSVEMYGLEPMTEAAPAKLTVELACTTAWGCYNATALTLVEQPDQWWENMANNPDSQVKWAMIRQQYSSSGLAAGYCEGVSSFTNEIRTKGAITSQEVTLCYSRDASDGVDIVVPFPNEYLEGNSPSLNVRVLEGGEVGMEVEVSLEASQVKTITVGADILREEGQDDKQELFRADLFYNAKRPFNIGLLRLRLEHRAGVRTISRPGSWMDVLASAGGASGFLLGLITGIRGLDPMSIVEGTCSCFD